MKGENEWIASGFSTKYDDGSCLYAIQLETFNEINFKRENMSFSDILLHPMEYELSDSSENGKIFVFYNTLGSDGDVLEDVYILNTTSTNTFLISKADTIDNIIEGEFTINYKIRNPNLKVNPNAPDNIKFSDVHFSIKL